MLRNCARSGDIQASRRFIDTSIIIDYLCRYAPAQAWLESETLQRFAITPLVWMETVQGAANNIEVKRAIRLLNQFSLEHPTPDDDLCAMRQIAVTSVMGLVFRM